MKIRSLKSKLKSMGLTVFEKVPLSRWSSVRTGGPAELMVFPETVEALLKLWTFVCEEGIPHFVLSGGSKVLFPDEGFRGVVINLRRLRGMSEIEPGRLEVLCGTPVSVLIAYGLSRGFSGAEFLAGVPATVGGALYMNAGAFGRTFSALVEEVELFTDGERRRLRADAGLWTYRKFNGPQGILLQATLKLEPSSRERVRERVLYSLSRRRQSQPLGLPSFGCVFKNPAEVSAGYLLDRAGLKGLSRGQAVISRKHANFILNRGEARARDIVYLMEIARDKVFKTFGIELEPEVKIVA